MPVRLKDIADDLNLSKMTISKVLRGQTDVSAETKARVLQRVKELNYRPNVTARSLRTGQTFTMGLIVPSMRETGVAEFSRGIDQAIRPEGYGLVVCPAQDDPELEQRQIELLLARQVDALLILPMQETMSSLEDIFRGQTVPLIFVSRRISGAKHSFVGVHEEEVGRIASQHLIERGCKRIAYLRGPHTSTGDLRYAGFRQALTTAGVPFHAEFVVDGMGVGEREYRWGHDGMSRLLAGRSRPDGVVAYTDMIAAGAMDAALGRGLRIPENVAFVGSGNDSSVCEMRVPLSSVDVAEYEVGQRSGRMAVKLASPGGGAGARKVLVSPKLVERHSSAR